MRKVTGSKFPHIVKAVSAVGLLFICLVVLMYPRKSYFQLSVEQLPPDPLSGLVDTRFLVAVQEGFRKKSLEFARYYGDQRNPSTFHPYFNVSSEIFADPTRKDRQLLALTGTNSFNHQVVAVVSLTDGVLRLIPNYNGGNKGIEFSADKVYLKNLDDDSDLEVVEALLLGDSGVWDVTRYDYDSLTDAYISTAISHESRPWI